MFAVAAAAALVCLSGCRTAPTARDAWVDGLAKCAMNDVLKSADALLYLGPSNVYGPGSAWRVTDDGDYEAKWPLDAAVVNEAKRKQLVVEGRVADCTVSRDTTWSIAPELLFSVATIPAEASARADFSTAEHAVVRVAKWRTDTLNETEYEQWMFDPSSGTYARDLLQNRPRRRVMKSAVLVMGFSANLSYSGAQAASIAAKYPLNTEVTVGGGLTVKRTSESTLSLNTQEPFYIIGTLLPFEQSGFGMTPSAEKRLLKREPQTVRSTARALPPSEGSK
jgi:hypothetical protein